MTTSPDTTPDAFRKRFEDEVFNRRFIASIQKVGTGCVTFMPVNCPTQAELMKRDPEHPDDYADEHISAMWFGAKLGAGIAAGSGELRDIASKLSLATNEGDDQAQGTHYVDHAGVIRCKGSFLELIERARRATA